MSGAYFPILLSGASPNAPHPKRFRPGPACAKRKPMAKAFQEWTVLPHEPLEKTAENLWSVAGTMPDGNNQRRMVVARLGDGRLVVHNAIALEEPLMTEIEAFGTPAFLLVPNGFHRQDAFIFKRRYPDLSVLCPRAAQKRVAQVVAPDGSYDDAPADERVRIFHLRGLKEREGAMLIRSDDGVSVVFNDAVLNMPKLGGIFGFLLSPTGMTSVPRIGRWITVSDAGEFRKHLEELADTPDLRRSFFAHGATLTEGVPEALRAAAARLG